MPPSPDKKRVLFVDDDADVLRGLRNLLYNDRARWEMVFAADGATALELVRERVFDVVVSDMRMPEMDGASLLTQVRTESPITARIMLSGHADREAIMRAVPVLHQLLNKPCDGATLRAAIARGCEDGLERASRLRAAIAGVDHLPSPRSQLAALASAIERSSTPTSEIVCLVEHDPSVAAKLLQLVNSSYFGIGRTSSIVEAVSILGIDLVRNIAATLTTPLDHEPVPEMPLAQLSVSAARVASIVAEIVGVHTPHARAASVLRDIGCSLLATNLTDEYRAAIAGWRGGDESIVQVEERVLGTTHAEVGARLLTLWGLPDELVEIVRYHHAPDRVRESLRVVTSVIHVVDSVVHPGARLDRDALARAGVADHVSGWLEIARRELDATA